MEDVIWKKKSKIVEKSNNSEAVQGQKVHVFIGMGESNRSMQIFHNGFHLY